MGTFGGLGTRVQLAGATFRPARTSNVGQYMEGSPSYELSRTANNIAHQRLSLLEELLFYKMNSWKM